MRQLFDFYIFPSIAVLLTALYFFVFTSTDYYIYTYGDKADVAERIHHTIKKHEMYSAARMLTVIADLQHNKILKRDERSELTNQLASTQAMNN